MRDAGLAAEDIAQVTLFAGSNVLGPIRFQLATTELEGKFSFQFLLAAIILRGRAGKAEFTDAFVASQPCQAMQGRIRTQFDPAIEAMGWDRIRSRVEVVLHDGRRLERWADENYRGGPDNPLSEAQLEAKFLDCAEGLIDPAASRRVMGMVWGLEDAPDVAALWPGLDWMRGRGPPA
jgi:2-methylcitrate dehydratase PrpD